jgi:hypothetical protein
MDGEGRLEEGGYEGKLHYDGQKDQNTNQRVTVDNKGFEFLYI